MTFNTGMPVPMRGEDVNQMSPIDVHFYMTHVNGYTFRLQPNQKFTSLSAGESETLRITGGGWAVSRSEVSMVTHKTTCRLCTTCCGFIKGSLSIIIPVQQSYFLLLAFHGTNLRPDWLFVALLVVIFALYILYFSFLVPCISWVPLAL